MMLRPMSVQPFVSPEPHLPFFVGIIIIMCAFVFLRNKKIGRGGEVGVTERTYLVNGTSHNDYVH